MEHAKNNRNRNGLIHYGHGEILKTCGNNPATEIGTKEKENACSKGIREIDESR